MNIPQMTITSRPARLSIEQPQGTQQIEQPRATQQIEQPAAILEMSSEASELTIDSTEAWASMEKKSPMRSASDYAKEGLQAIQEGIARRAQEGDQLMRIEHGGEAIQDIAKQTANPPPADFNVRFLLGRFGVDIDYKPREQQIDIQRQAPRIDAQVNAPVHNYTPNGPNIDIADYGDLSIDWKI